MEKVKKIIAAVLCVLVFAGVLAGCGEGTQTETGQANTGATQATTQMPTEDGWKEMEFTIMRASHPNSPFNADSPVLKKLYEKTKVKVKIQEVPYAEQIQKIQAAILSNALPDAFWAETGDMGFLTNYARTGIYLPISDYMDFMPDFAKLAAANPDLKKYYVDGKLYIFPFLYEEGIKSSPYPMIRKDILDNLNLPMPETWDDLYNALKKMKEAYPDSTPWGLRFAPDHGNFRMFYAYALGSGLANSVYAGKGVYFDKDVNGGQWLYGPIHPEFKEALAFYAKLVAEKLVSTEALNNQQWMDLYFTGKSFFFYDNSGYMNESKIKETNPNAEMVPVPVLKTSKGLQRNYSYGVQYSRGYYINKNVKDPEAVCRFMNYLYSQEGAELTNFGIEGEHFAKVNGKISLTQATIDKFKAEASPGNAFTAATGTGLNQLATMWLKPSMPFADEITANREEQISTMPGNIDPPHNPPFTLLEQDTINKITDPVWNYVWPEIVEIINGTTQISEWDNVVEEAKKLGAEQIEKIFNEAEARLK